MRKTWCRNVTIKVHYHTINFSSDGKEQGKILCTIITFFVSKFPRKIYKTYIMYWYISSHFIFIELNLILGWWEMIFVLVTDVTNIHLLQKPKHHYSRQLSWEINVCCHDDTQGDNQGIANIPLHLQWIYILWFWAKNYF